MAILTLAATPRAQASPQYVPVFNETFDVHIDYVTDDFSLLEETVWINSGGPVDVTFESATPVAGPVTLNISAPDASLAESCTILTEDTTCGLTIDPGDLNLGLNDITFEISNGSDSAELSGVLGVLDAAEPLVIVEVRDAAGNWINGNDVGLFLLPSMVIDVRCVYTNNANAPATFNTGSWNANLIPGPSYGEALTGTIAPGETAIFEMYSGPASGIGGHGCGGGVLFPTNSGAAGGGAGGGIVSIGGTITASPLAIDPGESVTVEAADISIPVGTYSVLVDGVPVTSGVTVQMPAGTFGVDVPFDSPGTYELTVVNTQTVGSVPFERELDITYAVYTVTVAAAQMPVTGADVAVTGALAAALIVAGGALLIARRRTA